MPPFILPLYVQNLVDRGECQFVCARKSEMLSLLGVYPSVLVKPVTEFLRPLYGYTQHPCCINNGVPLDRCKVMQLE